MQFAILVSVIIAVLLGSFLTLTHTHRFFNIQSKLFLNTIEQANAGIQYGLQGKHLFRDSINLEFSNSNTKVKRKFWGGFRLLESSSQANFKSFKKMALTGSKITTPVTSLYISESKIPLVLVGNTKIEGTAYLSNKGIKPGSIAGHYYNGKNLVKGKINYDAGNLPSLDQDWKSHISWLLDYIPTQNDDVIPIEEENKNSFFNPTQFVYDSEQLVLNESYTGNIIIKSETEIIITKYASITDVTLIAPRIIIEKGFKGSGSFIASESITIEEEVSLSYPSALIVLQKKIESNQQISLAAPILISENSFASGIVVFFVNENNPVGSRISTKVNIDIKPLAVVEGQVYCKGNTQLSGTVIGSVYTNRFVTKGFGSIYVNHIYNGKILANDLHPKFSGLPFSGSNNGIIKWLY